DRRVDLGQAEAAQGIPAERSLPAGLGNRERGRIDAPAIDPHRHAGNQVWPRRIVESEAERAVAGNNVDRETAARPADPVHTPSLMPLIAEARGERLPGIEIGRPAIA